jgi:hypothetical protein
MGRSTDSTRNSVSGSSVSNPQGEGVDEESRFTPAGNTIERAELSATEGDEERQRLIREAAYRRAEQRGFAPGEELDDWLAAEREIGEPRGDTALG